MVEEVIEPYKTEFAARHQPLRNVADLELATASSVHWLLPPDTMAQPR